MKAPNEFIEAYKKCNHYQKGDEVIDLEISTHSFGYSFMNLIIRDKDNYLWLLPFYFNQSAYECNEGEMSEADWIENDAEAWVESMAGATVWTEWFDDAEIFEL